MSSSISKLQTVNDGDTTEREGFEAPDQVFEEISFNGESHRKKSSKKSSLLGRAAFSIAFVFLLILAYSAYAQDSTTLIKKQVIQNIVPKVIQQPVKNSQVPFVEQTKIIEPIKVQQVEAVKIDQRAFLIPKFLWIFQQPFTNYIHFRCAENIKYYGRKSGYQVKIVNLSNYESFLQKSRALRLNLALRRVKNLHLLKVDEDAVSRYLILVNLVSGNGGAMIHRGPYALTQDLSWIEKIADSPFKLGKKVGFVPQVIAFYHAEISPKREFFNIEPSEDLQEVDKLIHEFPALEDMFLAAGKETQYLETLIQTLYHLINSNDQIGKYSKQYDIKVNIEFPRALVFTANQIVLKDKQKQIDQKAPPNSYKQFAFQHYYGVAFINSNYGPTKMKTFYQYWRPREKLFYSSYHDIARYQLEDLYDYTGPIKYLCQLFQQDHMSTYLRATADGNDITIYHGSLLQKFYFPQGYFPFIVNNPEKPFINQTNELWETFQKKVWLYWDNGFQNAAPFVQMCVDNLKRMAEASGFEIFLVTSKNINQFVPQQQLNRIKQTLDKKGTAVVQTYADFYRLALLYHNGGVYFDATSIAIEKFDWLLKIGRFPSQFIFNRFGSNPKAVLSFHPSQGMPGTWSLASISPDRTVKHQWYQGFENSFIAAEKHSQFIKEWKDNLFELILMSYDQIMIKFKQAGVHQHTFIDKKYQYLLPMDTAKYVLGKRQKLIEKDSNNKWINAAHYYQLWTFSTYLANTKLRYNRNYDLPRSFVNAYFTRYTPQYADQIVGKTRFFFKLFKDQKYFWEIDFFDIYQDCNFTQITHPRSIFRKFMWDEKFKPIFIEERRQKKALEQEKIRNSTQQRKRKDQQSRKKKQQIERQKKQEQNRKKKEDQQRKKKVEQDKKKKIQQQKSKGTDEEKKKKALQLQNIEKNKKIQEQQKNAAQQQKKKSQQEQNKKRIEEENKKKVEKNEKH